MLSTMNRLEETIKGPRSYTNDTDEEDRIKESPKLEGSPLPRNNGATKAEDDNMNLNGSTGDGDGNGKSPAPNFLSQEEVIKLASHSVENGIQETKRSLAGNEAVSDVVKPKLTIDLGHSNIGRVPEAVVDVIKDEVERCVRQSFHCAG